VLPEVLVAESQVRLKHWDFRCPNRAGSYGRNLPEVASGVPEVHLAFACRARTFAAMTDPRAPTSTPKAHPLARGVMRVLTDRDDADLRFVFAALARRIGPADGDGRRESALLALERCATE
jgi:hypothetical protein